LGIVTLVPIPPTADTRTEADHVVVDFGNKELVFYVNGTVPVMGIERDTTNMIKDI
jgi:hypothetical protein